MTTRLDAMERMAAAERADWPADATPEVSAEAAWVRAARGGDRAAFGALVRHHEAMVLRVAQRLLLNAHDAQDAAQDVFVRLYNHLDRFDEQRPLTPWIYRITVNVSKTHLRRRSRRNEVEQHAADATMLDATRPSSTETEDWLERGLARLTPRERTALVLRDLEGLSAKEAASAMRCTPATVRTLAARGRLKLKQLHDAEQRGLDQ